MAIFGADALLACSETGRTRLLGDNRCASPRRRFGQAGIRMLRIDERQQRVHAPIAFGRVLRAIEDRHAGLFRGLARRLMPSHKREFVSLDLCLTLEQTHPRQVVQFGPAIGQFEHQAVGPVLANPATHRLKAGIGRYLYGFSHRSQISNSRHFLIVSQREEPEVGSFLYEGFGVFSLDRELLPPNQQLIIHRCRLRPFHDHHEL